MNEDQFFLICFMIFLLWISVMGVTDLFRSRKKKYLVTLSFGQPYDYSATYEVEARGKIDAERTARNVAMYRHHVGFRSITVISIKRKDE